MSPPSNGPDDLVAKLNACSFITGAQMTAIAQKYTHIGATMKLERVPPNSSTPGQPDTHYCTYTDPSSNGLDILQIAYFSDPSNYPSQNKPSFATNLINLPYGATDGWFDSSDFVYRYAAPNIQLYFGGTGDQTIDISTARLRSLVQEIAAELLPQVTNCLKVGC